MTVRNALLKAFLWLMIFIPFLAKAESIFDAFYNPSKRTMPEDSLLIGELTSDIDRNVYLKDSQAFIFSEVPQNESIYNKDSIFVGPRGGAKIRMIEAFGGGEIILTPNTVITISKVGDKTITPIIELKKGTLSVAKSQSTPEADSSAKTKSKTKFKLKPQKSFIVQSGSKAVILKTENEVQTLNVTANNPLEVVATPVKSSGTAPPKAAPPKVEIFNTGDLMLSLENGKKLEDIVEKKVQLSKSPDIIPSPPPRKAATLMPESKSRNLLLGRYIAPPAPPVPPAEVAPVATGSVEAPVAPKNPPEVAVTTAKTKKKEKTAPNHLKKEAIAEEKIKTLQSTEESSSEASKEKDHRFEALAGGALIKQSFKSSAGSSSANNLGYRFRASWHYSEVIQLSLRHLGTLNSTSTAVNNKVSWSVLSSEFRVFQKPVGSSFYVPNLRLVLGIERFNNSISSATESTNYISSYVSGLAGFRSRFTLSERWDIGGDFLSTLLSNGFKMHVQGDLNYRINSTFSVGGGYWLEYAKVSSSNISETTFAIESYVQVRF